MGSAFAPEWIARARACSICSPRGTLWRGKCLRTRRQGWSEPQAEWGPLVTMFDPTNFIVKKLFKSLLQAHLRKLLKNEVLTFVRAVADTSQRSPQISLETGSVIRHIYTACLCLAQQLWELVTCYRALELTGYSLAALTCSVVCRLTSTSCKWSWGAASSRCAASC